MSQRMCCNGSQANFPQSLCFRVCVCVFFVACKIWHVLATMVAVATPVLYSDENHKPESVHSVPVHLLCVSVSQGGKTLIDYVWNK